MKLILKVTVLLIIIFIGFIIFMGTSERNARKKGFTKRLSASPGKFESHELNEVFRFFGIKDPDGLKVKTLKSLRKVDEFPLYVMEYFADYNLDSFIERNLQFTPKKRLRRRKAEKSCGTFSALSKKGDAIFGHNIDWSKFPLLLLFTYPPGKGYASVSTVDISKLGYESQNPQLFFYKKCPRLLNAPFYIHDGMNECGLAIGEMSVNGDRIVDPKKKTIGPLLAIRLVLDRAKNVDEAIAIFQSYNNSTGDVHYLIADAEGNSAVVEYKDGKIVVTRNKEPWQVATNFIINNAEPGSILHLCGRYKRGYLALQKTRGNIPQTQAMDILKSMSQVFLTQWSVVYNMTGGDVSAVVGRKYNNVMKFKLKMRGKE